MISIESRLEEMNSTLLVVGNDWSDVLLDAVAELATLRTRAERAEAALEARDPTKSQIKRITAMADGRLEAAQSKIAELTGQVGRLRDFASELADEGCSYGDDCPPFAGTRHGTCLACKARAALGAK